MQNFPNKCVIVLIAAKDAHKKDAHKKTDPIINKSEMLL